jgi:hypothetical protein
VRRHLTGERQKGYAYYRCHGAACAGVSWRGNVLEGVVFSNIARIRLTEREVGDIRDLVEHEYRARQGEQGRLKASLVLRLQHLDDRLTRLTDLLIDEAIDQPTFAVRKEKLLLERQRILDEMRRADHASPLQDLFDEFERENSKLVRYESLTDDEKRELIDFICSNFSVRGKTPTFTLRSPYFELAKLEQDVECGHHRDDVRTRSKKIFEIIKSLADKEFRDGDMKHIIPLDRLNGALELECNGNRPVGSPRSP